MRGGVKCKIQILNFKLVTRKAVRHVMSPGIYHSDINSQAFFFKNRDFFHCIDTQYSYILMLYKNEPQIIIVLLVETAISVALL